MRIELFLETTHALHSRLFFLGIEPINKKDLEKNHTIDVALAGFK